MKKLTIRQVAAVKRNAQNVASLVASKNKLAEKISELVSKYDEVVAQIDAYEAGTKAMTGGYTSEMLVDRVVESTGKQDANGRDLKITKYVPKANVLVLDEDGKAYSIMLDEPVVANGSDLDIDADTPNVEMVEDNSFDPTAVM